MTLSPKRLSIREMWKLYKTIESGIPEKEEPYLFHQVMKVIEGITTPQFEDSIKIMYGNKVLKKQDTLFALLFIKGIKKNSLFAFSSFIKGMSNDASR